MEKTEQLEVNLDLADIARIDALIPRCSMPALFASEALEAVA